jgi:hypothetical protein
MAFEGTFCYEFLFTFLHEQGPQWASGTTSSEQAVVNFLKMSVSNFFMFLQGTKKPGTARLTDKSQQI